MRSWKYSVSTVTVLLALSATGPVTANLSDDKNLAPSTHDVPIVAWSLVILSILYWSVGIMIAGAMRTPSHQPASFDHDASP